MPRVVNRPSRNLGMLDKHKEIIRKNYEILVRDCEIQDLIPKLLGKNVFSQEMIEAHTGASDLDTKQKLFTSITKRGPNAFHNLIQSLRESDQHNLANILENAANDNINETNRSKSPNDNYNLFNRGGGDTYMENHNGTTVCNLPNYAQHRIENLPHLDHLNVNITLRTVPLNVDVKLANKFYDGDVERHYQTHSKRRGAVLVINNRKFINDVKPLRNGAEFDDRNLNALFEQMNMSVDIYIDLKEHEMKAAINDFASSSKLKHVDMIFIIVMSHGQKIPTGTVVISNDNKQVSTDWIEQQFSNDNCPNMQKKPKILVYQTCRGEFGDFGTTTKRVETDSAVRHQVPIRTLSDTLIAHSTLDGYASHRDTEMGSWFIQLICEVFMEYAHNTHVEDLFKIVDQKLEYYRSESMSMQTSCYTSKGFNKKCYLHPGIYKEDDVLKRFNS